MGGTFRVRGRVARLEARPRRDRAAAPCDPRGDKRWMQRFVGHDARYRDLVERGNEVVRRDNRWFTSAATVPDLASLLLMRIEPLCYRGMEGFVDRPLSADEQDIRARLHAVLEAAAEYQLATGDWHPPSRLRVREMAESRRAAESRRGDDALVEREWAEYRAACGAAAPADAGTGAGTGTATFAHLTGSAEESGSKVATEKAPGRAGAGRGMGR